MTFYSKEHDDFHQRVNDEVHAAINELKDAVLVGVRVVRE